MNKPLCLPERPPALRGARGRSLTSHTAAPTARQSGPRRRSRDARLPRRSRDARLTPTRRRLKQRCSSTRLPAQRLTLRRGTDSRSPSRTAINPYTGGLIGPRLGINPLTGRLRRALPPISPLTGHFAARLPSDIPVYRSNMALILGDLAVDGSNDAYVARLRPGDRWILEVGRVIPPGHPPIIDLAAINCPVEGSNRGEPT